VLLNRGTACQPQSTTSVRHGSKDLQLMSQFGWIMGIAQESIPTVFNQFGDADRFP